LGKEAQIKDNVTGTRVLTYPSLRTPEAQRMGIRWLLGSLTKESSAYGTLHSKQRKKQLQLPPCVNTTPWRRRGCGGNDTNIHNLDLRLSLAVSFTLQPL